MIRASLLAVLLFASEPTVGAQFAFVKPGQTTQAEAVKHAGKPFIEYDTSIIDGEVDVFVQVPGPTELRQTYARAGTQKVAHVHVAEWDGRKGWRETVRLVFLRDGELLYALLPVNASEASLEELKSRYGRDPKISSRERTRGDLTTRYRFYTYPEEGVAYYGKGEKIERKALFSPAKSR